MRKKLWIYIDLNDENSISRAEKEKLVLENNGYNLKKTEQVGLNFFRLIYSR